MIASSERFGSSGGGGSNRDVVFTLRVRDDGKAAQAFDAMAKRIDDLQRKAGNIRIGFDGASAGPGGAPAGRGGVAPSGRGGTRGNDPYGDYNRMRDRELREQQNHNRRLLREQQRHDAELRRNREREARRDFEAIERENQRWQQRNGRRRPGKPGEPSSPGLGFSRGELGEALEGVTSLARAFVLLGVSGEENIEKAVRALAKFEAAAQGVRGVMKISGPLGGALTAGAAKFGMGAGAGAGAIGAAGLAAIAGTVGSGFAISDLINYNRNGRIGAYSQGHANLGTRFARGALGMGLDPTQGLGYAMFSSPFSPLGGAFYASGYTQAVTARAKGDIAYEGGLQDRARGGVERLIDGQRQLNEERLKLYRIEQGNALNQGQAEAYGGLRRWEQRDVLRMRDRYLADPNSLSDAQLARIKPFLGSQEQQQIGRQQMGRAGALFERGHHLEKNIRLDQAQLQREIVMKLEINNDAVVQSIKETFDNAYRLGNEDLDRKMNELRNYMEDSINRVNQQGQYARQATVNAYGGP